MIAATAEDMVVLMKARDILNTRTGEAKGLCETVRDGLNLVIRMIDMVSADDPRLQGDSSESSEVIDTWVGGVHTPQQLPGIPFKPKTPGTIKARHYTDEDHQVWADEPSPTAKFIDEAVKESSEVGLSWPPIPQGGPEGGEQQ